MIPIQLESFTQEEKIKDKKIKDILRHIKIILKKGFPDLLSHV